MTERTSRGATVAEWVDGLESLLASGMRALIEDGDLRAGRERFDLAYKAAERAGDSRAMAAAALGMGGVWVHEHRTVTGAALLQARLQQALALVEPDSLLALRLRIRLAGEADYRLGESATVLALLDEARSEEDAVARAEALSLTLHCLLGPDHRALRRALSKELVEASLLTRRRSDLLMGLLWRTVDLFHDGDPYAERSLDELRALLACDDHLAVGYVVSAMDVMLAIRAGCLEQAEKLAGVCAELGTAAGDVDATGWRVAQLVAIRWYQGRLPELLPTLSDLVHSNTLSVVDNSCLAALAVASAMAGDRPRAASALATLCGRDLADLPRSSSWVVTMNGIVEAAYVLEDAETSERVYQLLGAFADLPVVGSLGVVCFGSVHHALGVASLTVGETDRAVGHFQEAVRRNLALAHWPAVVASRLRLAEALDRRARPEDAAAADLEAAAAAEVTEALGIDAPSWPHQAPSTVSAVCNRLGRNWRVELGYRSALAEHSVGMSHLAVLIANPGREIPAVDLASGLALLGDKAASEFRMSTQPVLDRVADREYRRRLTQLRIEIEQSESRGDLEEAARAVAERDWLVHELVGATGLGGRGRQFADDGERARVAVSKAIRRALVRIADADAVIGEHLRGAVTMGVRCVYRPW